MPRGAQGEGGGRGGSERAGSKSNGIIMGSRVEGFNFGNGCAFGSPRSLARNISGNISGEGSRRNPRGKENLREFRRRIVFFFFFFDRLGSEFSLISKETKEMEQQEVSRIIIIGLKCKIL